MPLVHPSVMAVSPGTGSPARPSGEIEARRSTGTSTAAAASAVAPPIAYTRCGPTVRSTTPASAS